MNDPFFDLPGYQWISPMFSPLTQGLPSQGGHPTIPAEPPAARYAVPCFGKKREQSQTNLSPDYSVPDRWTFYKSGLKKHFVEERQEGSERFYHQVLMNKKRRLMLFSGVTILSVLLAAARGSVRTLMHIGIMGALMPLPILSANRAIPQLADAYDIAKQGNPKKADEMFSDAIDEFNYSVFQRFFKPITYAIFLTALLTLPQNLAKPKTQWKKIAEHYVKQAANKLSGKERFPTAHPHSDVESRNVLESIVCWPVEKLDRLFAPNKGKWSVWLGNQAEQMGWKRQYQPYTLLKKGNVKLQEFGDEWEEWMREKPLLNKMLGKPQDHPEVGASETRR